jgi:hypothetical protein
MSFTLNNLSDTEFENLCFDILQSLDFVNLSWRKGTGLTSSPSDQGRDIQGELLRKDVDGREHHEKWFVECKHYVKGVPPDKIQGAISWANAKRPDVLLIVASNFLSNPTKNYLDEYQKQNKPPYRIKVWELKDLENLTAGKNDLRRKYGLPTEIAFLPILNNYHIVYSMKPQLNTIEYFLELMDSLDPQKRDEAFSMAYFDIVQPRFKAPITGDEKLADLKIDADDYEAFRKKCLYMSSEASPTFVHKLMSSALAWLFHAADKTSLANMQDTQRFLIERIETDIAEEEDKEFRNRLSKMLELTQRMLMELPERMERYYGLYTYICDELVRKLLAEKPSLRS